MNKVRYLTISRVSIELVEKLSDQENAQFNRIIFSCFQQLENGQKPAYQETDSPILNIALREAAAELETGYKNYIQKVNAKKGSSDPQPAENRRSTADQPETDQRSTADQPETDKRREEKREEKKRSEESIGEGIQRGEPFSRSEQWQLNNDLAQARISADDAFWNTARKAGYSITHEAIRKAIDEKSESLPYVVKLMTEAAEGGRS